MGPFASLKFLTLIYAISAIAVLPIRDVAPGSLTPDGRAAKSGIVVVQCSRATGRVAPRRRLHESGIVAGEDLRPAKSPRSADAAGNHRYRHHPGGVPDLLNGRGPTIETQQLPELMAALWLSNYCGPIGPDTSRSVHPVGA
jgi:hypothetical protein